MLLHCEHRHGFRRRENQWETLAEAQAVYFRNKQNHGLDFTEASKPYLSPITEQDLALTIAGIIVNETLRERK